MPKNKPRKEACNCGNDESVECAQTKPENTTDSGDLFSSNRFRLLLASLAIVVPLEILSFFSIRLPDWIELPLLLVVILAFGRDVVVSGVKSLAKLRFSDINLLMTVAIFGALFLQEFVEAAVIVTLFALANSLEDYGFQRSQRALDELVKKTPKTAQVKGESGRTAVDGIRVGQVIVVKPGDQIPLDGIVTAGDSSVDESSITGEPLPKSKQKGDAVFAGTLNTQGYLEVRVSKTSENSALAKIIELTYESAEKKAHSQKMIEKFAEYYTPLMLVIALLIVAVPVLVLNQPFAPWFTQALTILIISCPCALVISTPVSVFSAIGNASKKGVVIKGGQFLEELGRVKAIGFDKTRTLTRGEPHVSDVLAFNGFTKEAVLACVAGLEAHSEHPLAQSIIRKATESKLEVHRYSGFKAVPGKGVTGTCLVCQDAHHCVGNLKFIKQEHAVEEKVEREIERFEREGKTVVIASDGKQIKGIIAISDQVRPEAASTVAELSKLGVTPVILTGDHASSAEYVGKSVGIREVHAGLLPENKVEKISELSRRYSSVAMVGDGVNDAPALASANVSIALGAVGSDAAIENADIALMNNNLALIPYLVRLGRRTVRTIRVNVAVSVLVKVVFLLLAIAGLGNLALAIFADVGVTLFVVLNSLRLYHASQ